MKEHCVKNLSEIEVVLTSLTNDQYVEPIDVLSGSSIGQHVRHVLEFYICLIEGVSQGVINYDLRKRDLNIESDLEFCRQELLRIQSEVITLSENRDLVLEGLGTTELDSSFSIPTNLLRELSYNLEHSIHHQALIKIGLKFLNGNFDLADSFGVAPSTIRSNQLQKSF